MHLKSIFLSLLFYIIGSKKSLAPITKDNPCYNINQKKLAKIWGRNVVSLSNDQFSITGVTFLWKCGMNYYRLHLIRTSTISFSLIMLNFWILKHLHCHLSAILTVAFQFGFHFICYLIRQVPLHFLLHLSQLLGPETPWTVQSPKFTVALHLLRKVFPFFHNL